MDQVRVLRIIEYSGDRDRVEETIAKSIKYHKVNGMVIRGATIGDYPEILSSDEFTNKIIEDSLG